MSVCAPLASVVALLLGTNVGTIERMPKVGSAAGQPKRPSHVCGSANSEVGIAFLFFSLAIDVYTLRLSDG